MQPTGNHEEDIRRKAVRQALGAMAGLLEVGVVAVDPEGRTWFRSQRWQDTSSTGDEAYHGAPWWDGVHPEDRDGVAERWRSLLGRQGRIGAFRATGADGTVRRCRAESVPMVGVDGRVEAHLLLVTDASPDPVGGEGPDEAEGPGAGEGSGAGEGPGAVRSASAPAPVLVGPHVLGPVLAGAPDIITILNEDGSWRWSSSAALRLFGHQAEFDARNWLDRLLHPEDIETAQEAFAGAVAGERPPDRPFIFRVRTADGSWRVMEGLFDVLLDEPSVRGVVVHIRDVTEQRRVLDALEASNRRLVDALASMRAAMVVEDEHGRIVLANQAFVDMFHLAVTAEEMVGRTLPEIGFTVDHLVVDPPDAGVRLAAVRRRGERVVTGRAVLIDGRTVEVDYVPTRARGSDRGNLWAVRDISRRVRAEAERERLLASEREENRRLAEMDAYRSESIAAVSHELRTPLTSIVGYTQLLRNMVEPAGRAEEIECVDAIARNVDRLLRLAGDVLALDSLESRMLPLRVAPVDIAGALRDAMAALAGEAAARSITVTVDARGDRPLRADGDRLGQLFENLLSNAVKFTPPEGRVAVTARQDGAEWVVEVADTGIGIPDDEIQLLFGRFFRASNARTRGIPGSGLGLSVARAIAERHGGKIVVDSTVGVGTTVTVRLGDAPEDDEEASMNPGPGPGPGPAGLAGPAGPA